MRSKPSIIPLLGCALVLAAVPLTAQEVLLQAERGPYRATPFIEGLQDPWSMAFLPGGEMLVTERPGRLRLVRDGVLHPEAIAGTPAVRAVGQGGLLEVLPHPDFAANRLIYLTFSKPSADGAQATTAVIRGRLEGMRLEDVEEIFEAKAWSGTGGHYGSRMVFDADGYLFVTIGDRQAPPIPGSLESHPAQDLSNHQGTVVRLHDDGRVPSDNPFVGREGVLPEIWSYGHRSPQGLAIHPTTGDLWMTEHGPQGGDELNVLLPGRNYGWPVIGYGVQYGGAKLHAETHRDGMEQPIQTWTPSIATSGLMFYTGDVFPEWQEDLFVGGLTGHQLVRLPLVGEGRQPGRMERPPLLLGLGRVRDVRQGPDGYIYVALENRQRVVNASIIRLEPAQPDS